MSRLRQISLWFWRSVRLLFHDGSDRPVRPDWIGRPRNDRLLAFTVAHLDCTATRARAEPCAHVENRALNRLRAAKAGAKVAQAHDVIGRAEVDREVALALPV